MRGWDDAPCVPWQGMCRTGEQQHEDQREPEHKSELDTQARAAATQEFAIREKPSTPVAVKSMAGSLLCHERRSSANTDFAESNSSV